MKIRKKNKNGFTLIEILVALVIVLIVSSLSYAVFFGLNQSQVLEKETQTLIALIKKERSSAIQGEEASKFGVHFEEDSNEIILFKGNSYDENDPDNRSFFLDDAVVISDISLVGGSDHVIFNRIRGTTDQFGTITLSLVQNAQLQSIITIRSTGIIEKN